MSSQHHGGQVSIGYAYVAPIQAGEQQKPHRLFPHIVFRPRGASLCTLLGMWALMWCPLGRKIIALERVQFEQTEHAAVLADMVAATKTLETDIDRKQLLEHLTALMGGETALIDVLLNISLGTALGAEAAKPEGQPRMEPVDIIATVEASREALRGTLGPMVFAQNASMYKSLTIEELKQYRDLLASPLGQKSVNVSLAAFNSAMKKQALAIGARFAKEWNAQKM
jgi:hypothetical protein